MNYLLVIGLFLSSIAFNYAQNMTIVNKLTQSPIEGVVINSTNLKSLLLTDANGQVDISLLSESEIIQLNSLGYKTIQSSYAAFQKLNYIVEMEPLLFTLDQVTISATKWRQSSGNSAYKITSISAQEVALQNPQTAADLLSISGKVFIQKSQQGGGSPMIRGFATNRLIYSVDGVRMNNAIFRGGNLQNIISLDPFAIANTEVLLGPNSVIYGSDAIGGVMSFETLKPQLSSQNKPSVGGKAFTRYSSANNEKTAHFDINIGREKWAWVSSFSFWDFDHLRQGRLGPKDYLKSVYPARIDNQDVVVHQTNPLLQIPTAYNQVNFMQKVRFKPTNLWDFEYGFHYSETSAYGRYDRHNRYRNGTIQYAEWDYGPQKWMMNNFVVTHDGHYDLFDKLSVRFAQQSFKESRIERTFNSSVRSTYLDNVEAYSINMDFLKNVGSQDVLYYGIEYILNDVLSQGVTTDITSNINHVGPARYPWASWSSFAGYLNYDHKLSNKMTIQSGLRYNHFYLKSDFSNNTDFYPLPFTTADVNNGALTGSLGGVYRPSDTWVFKTNLGTAFRSPNVDDMGKVFDSEPGAVTVPNTSLKAEYAYNIDLSLAKVFYDIVKVDITGYYTLLQKALVRRNFQLNGQDSLLYKGVMSQIQAVQNAAMARVYGCQIGMELKLASGFLFVTDVNIQRGIEELDSGLQSPARHAAPSFGISRLRFQKGDLTLEINAMYQAERSFEDLAIEERGKTEIYAKDKNGNNYAPSWYTLNFKSNYIVNAFLSVGIGLENITDIRYRPYSSGLSGAGRNFVMSVKWEF